MVFLKKIVFNLVFFFLALSVVPKTLASEEFKTDYQITYLVNPDSSVAVEQNINLTNKLANIYASQYQVTLGTTKVRGVYASDGQGEITPQVEKKENSTTIKVDFNQKVVGKDNTLKFTINYITDDYAMRNGRVLEVGIPKIAENEQLDSYQVNLIIPYIFEEPAFILPHPTKINDNEKGRVYQFKQLKNQSITAAFGNFQVFNFDLSYYLENNSANLANFEISLPPDTFFQKIFLESLTPLPKNIYLDSDNNWLANYQLKPEEKIKITATGSAQIFMNPRENFPALENINFNDYLKDQQYWEVNNPQIKELAKQLKTPQAIYDFVASNLLYDYARVKQEIQRRGGLGALKNKESAICMEFSDLFITLARAAGIPAREVNGFAYTNNPKLRPLSLKQDVLHAWPQYYNKQQGQWVSIDPTWGNTTGGIDFFNKLDLNHFAFVFHGLDSQLPLPPGSFKKEGEEPSKDVQIDFGQEVKEKIDLSLEVDLPDKLPVWLPIKGKVKIKNKGNTAIYQQKLVIKSEDLNYQKEIPLKTLLPLASFEKEVSLSRVGFLNQGVKKITVKYYNQEKTKTINIHSFLPAKIIGFLSRIIKKILAIIKK